MAASIAVREPNAQETYCEVLDGPAALEALKPEWTQLWEDACSQYPYCHPEWLRAYLSAFEPGCELILLAAYSRQGRLAGVLPLIKERARHRGFPVRRLRTPTNPHVTRFDVLRTQGPAGDFAFRAIWNAMMDLPGWDIAELDVFPQPTTELVKGAANDSRCGLVIVEKGSYIIPLGTYGDNPLRWQAELSSHMRSKLRRIKKKLDARSGTSSATVCNDSSNREMLEGFYRIEASGWKGATGTNTAIICADNTRRFYDEIAKAFTKYGLFTLYTYMAGQTGVAGAYAIRAHGRECVLKLGFLEEYKECAPGLLLVDDILHKLWDNSVGEFDFGPDNDYKRHWTANVVSRFTYTIFKPTVYARFLYHLESHVRPAVREIAKIGSAEAETDPEMSNE